MAKINLQQTVRDWWLIGGLLGLVTYFLAKYVSKIPLIGDGIVVSMSAVDINLMQQVTEQGALKLSGMAKLVSSITGFLGGKLPLLNSWQGLLAAVIAGLLIVFVGKTLYDFYPKGKDQYWKLAVIILYGVAAFTGLSFAFVKGLGWAYVLAMGLYYVVVAFVMYLLAKLLSIKIPV